MILSSKHNDNELMALAPSIQHHINEWQIVNINITKNSTLSQKEIIERLLKNYEQYEGLIYPVSDTKIMMLARLGIIHNYATMKTDIEKKLPKHCCRIALRKMNAAGLKQVKIDIVEKNDDTKLHENLHQRRLDRSENIILIADDDKLIRTAMSKLLAMTGTLVQEENGAKVITQYLNHNPDIVFLDIHMPGKNGLETVKDLIALDPDAFIILLSADSSADNVLKALEEGAAGFLSKPPAKEKVQDYISQCLTMR